MSDDRDVLRALVVDDESAVRRLTCRALSQAGFQCDEAADGRQGASLAGAHRYDLVVTDLRMPEQNGHALCVGLLAQEERPAVVVLTGVVNSDLYNDLVNRGIDDVCYKPVDYRSFAEKSRHIVERRRARGHSRRESAAGPLEPAGEASRISAPVACEAAPSGPTAGRLALVLMADAERAKRLAAALSSPGARAIPVEGSEELWNALVREQVDLLVLEEELRGFLRGTEILRRMRNALLLTPAVLVATPARELETQSEQLGLRSIVGPLTRDDAIVAAARRALAEAGEHRGCIIAPVAARLVDECGEIPPLPQYVAKLLACMPRDARDMTQQELLRRVVEHPGASEILLRAANSAAHGLKRRITNVADAVKLLGLKRTIAIGVSSATDEVEVELMRHWSPSQRDWYRGRSRLSAQAASLFAERVDCGCHETAFVLGRLQDVGILLMAKRFGARYEAVLERFRLVARVQLHQLEAEEFGITHADVSAATARRWELPEHLVSLIRDHHRAEPAVSRLQSEQELIRFMQIGESLSDLLDVPDDLRCRRFRRLLSGSITLDPARLEAWISQTLWLTKAAYPSLPYALPDSDEMSQLFRLLAFNAESAVEPEFVTRFDITA